MPSTDELSECELVLFVENIFSQNTGIDWKKKVVAYFLIKTIGKYYMAQVAKSQTWLSNWTELNMA